MMSLEDDDVSECGDQSPLTSWTVRDSEPRWDARVPQGAVRPRIEVVGHHDYRERDRKTVGDGDVEPVRARGIVEIYDELVLEVWV
jgi:hypothetical protein